MLPFCGPVILAILDLRHEHKIHSVYTIQENTRNYLNYAEIDFVNANVLWYSRDVVTGPRIWSPPLLQGLFSLDDKGQDCFRIFGLLVRDNPSGLDELRAYCPNRVIGFFYQRGLQVFNTLV
jgi:hypothetical protein